MNRIIAGIVAGLAGGIVFGIMMQMMTAPTPDMGEVPMMAMVAMVVGSTSLFVGWVYHLFNSAVIGGLFGLVLGQRVTSYGAGAGWGALWGVVWWVLGGLILMPIMLGMPAFAPLTAMPMVAMGSLVGHLIFGVITGLVYLPVAAATGASSREVAR